MTYQMYRTTTLGKALESSLEDFVAQGLIPESLSNEVLKVFDRKFAESMATKAKNKVSFKADKLRAYRFCDNVWTFLMEEVDFRDANRPIDGKVKRVKFVACDASTSKAATTPVMAYQMYRTTTLGQALEQTLDEFVSDGQIPRSLSNVVMRAFDARFSEALQNRARNKVTFKAEKLRVYRFCDNVWTFLLEDVDIRDMHLRICEPVERLKIVACDGRPPIGGKQPPAIGGKPTKKKA